MVGSQKGGNPPSTLSQRTRGWIWYVFRNIDITVIIYFSCRMVLSWSLLSFRRSRVVRLAGATVEVLGTVDSGATVTPAEVAVEAAEAAGPGSMGTFHRGTTSTIPTVFSLPHRRSWLMRSVR